MITLNDYLYSGDTVLRILQKYSTDLRNESVKNKNVIDAVHADFLDQIEDLLEHNDFLTAQANRLKGFYVYMAKHYPFLAFTFKGRIKSLIRAEGKFNGYIVSYIYDYFMNYGTYPSMVEMKKKLGHFRDLIAYRIVISVPRCHLQAGESQTEKEIDYLYEIANALPKFLQETGFEIEKTGGVKRSSSPLMAEDVKEYFRDYVSNTNAYGYRSLHITVYDPGAGCNVEIQLRTKEMDDIAEIGLANHDAYESRQRYERSRRDAIPQGACQMFDEAYERSQLLQQLELSKVDINMFAAVNNSLINDGCGLFRGRQITPYEHLSRFQSDTF